ncbi:hypothetical protein OPQ81_010568 [Rhizoctonia solani]|nr:hypothetical protein OPQ81_010568 [Rhizoctonia solani]
MGICSGALTLLAYRCKRNIQLDCYYLFIVSIMNSQFYIQTASGTGHFIGIGRMDPPFSGILETVTEAGKEAFTYDSSGNLMTVAGHLYVTYDRATKKLKILPQEKDPVRWNVVYGTGARGSRIQGSSSNEFWTVSSSSKEVGTPIRLEQEQDNGSPYQAWRFIPTSQYV